MAPPVFPKPPITTWIATALAALPAALHAAPDAELTRVYYEREVMAAYCGLGSARSTAGFQRAEREIVARKNLNQKDRENARTQAWKDAHAEWSNRGLGGFKNWCRTEGAAAMERFEEMAR
ncbi:MAG: hypothetical protein OXU31_09815 [Gammaproteobacteria bacterium]|nr:hypothetical protein [Gammaproteobacteria bacterium]